VAIRKKFWGNKLLGLTCIFTKRWISVPMAQAFLWSLLSYFLCPADGVRRGIMFSGCPLSFRIPPVHPSFCPSFLPSQISFSDRNLKTYKYVFFRFGIPLVHDFQVVGSRWQGHFDKKIEKLYMYHSKTCFLFSRYAMWMAL
jgi:hypothetical protein